MSSHDDSSHLPVSCYTDHSHHETATAESYINRGLHASGRGIINNINQYHTHSRPLEELQKHCSHSAAFDSAARDFDPPRCAESTRLQIIQIIEGWINNDEHTTVQSSLFWLHGGAGVGKSALAQSLSEKFHERNQLAASFFFFRSDPTRNGEHLIPTLVSHLVRSFKGILPFVEDRIRDNPTLFTKRCQAQIQELLVEPLLALKSVGVPVTHPRLIVIDGLDECDNPDVQSELLRVIARAIPQIPYPLRFLVTSRPEAHITHVFKHDPGLQAITIREYNLSDDPDADADIRKFFEKEFAEIRRIHRLGRHLPLAWPDRHVTSLVERSSGHFIYASTVIRYIRSPKHRPDDRLEVILQLRPPREGDQPYAQLDALYTFIFQGVEDHEQLEKICLTLGILYLQSKRAGFLSDLILDHATIEGLLDMKAGDLVLLLDPILSLVAVDDDKVHVLHKSLFDYLLDFTRSGHLPFDLAQVHQSVATYILCQKIMNGACVGKNLLYFHYHCRHAFLNDTLKDYLHLGSSPKSITTLLKPSLIQGIHSNDYLRSIIWHFFRTLSREDFDPTGQVYEQNVAKWMGHLHSEVPWRNFRQIRAAVKVDSLKYWLKRKLDEPLPGRVAVCTRCPLMPPQGVEALKHEIDRLLMEWKPHINPKDVGMLPVRCVALVRQEHTIFSAFSKGSFGDSMVSSLVIGDHFIHSYDVGIGHNETGFLSLRTYSKHGGVNTCYQRTITGNFNIVDFAQDYLEKVGKYLFSVHYQKYGLQLDDDIYI